MPTRDPLSVRCLHTVAEMACLRLQINALNLDSPRPDPFSTFEFYENFLERGDTLHLGSHSRVWFLAAFRGTELVGYLALKEARQRLLGRPFNRLDSLAAHNADRPRVVARAADVSPVTSKFYTYLLARETEWDFLELQQQQGSASALYPPPEGIRFRRHWLRTWPNMDNCTIPIRWPTLDAYFEALAHKFRSNLRRQLRKLVDAGTLELLSSSDPAGTRALLELYLRVEDHSWKVGTEYRVGGSAERTAYYTGLLDRAQPMQIVIHILLLDGVPVAGLICGSFSTNGTRGLHALQMAFDVGLAPMAPGSAILLMGVRHAIEGGYAFLNLLGGFGYYKARWLAVVTPTYCAQFYRIGHLLFWRRVVGDAQRWLASQIRWLRRSANAPSPGSTADEHFAGKHPVAAARVVTVAEREAIAGWIATARQGQCEYLDAAALRAALPFAMSRGGKGAPGDAATKKSRPAHAGYRDGHDVSEAIAEPSVPAT